MMTSVVIMAGGEGTRIRPLTFSRPKPLVPIVNRPILDYIFHRITCSDYEKVIMTLGYLKNQIESYAESRYPDVDFRFHVEKKPLGTAGGVKAASGHIDETFIVLSGDVLFDLDLKSLLNFHRSRDALVTIALTPVEDPSHYGIAILDSEMKIKRFHEKPRPHEAFSKIANAGIYVMEPEILDKIPSGPVDFSKDVFPELIEEDMGVYGFVFDGYWNDVGKPDTFLRANHDVLKGYLKPDPPGELINERPGQFGNIWVGEDVRIGRRVRITGPAVIGDGAEIGDGAFIGRNTVLGSGVSVGRGSIIKGSVIFDGGSIGRSSHLINCILDDGSVISEECVIDRCAMVGRGVEIGPGTVIRSRRRIRDRIRIIPGSLVDSDYLMRGG